MVIGGFNWRSEFHSYVFTDVASLIIIIIIIIIITIIMMMMIIIIITIIIIIIINCSWVVRPVAVVILNVNKT